jgi:HPt (histidine-containing phosphotransfer) domain-containing protein
MTNSLAVENDLTALDQTPLPTASGFRLDREAILARLQGDEELFRELVALFMSDTPSLLKEARKALASGDADTLQRTAHTIKGSVSNFGGGPAVEAAWLLEQIGRAGDLTGGADALMRVEHALAVVEGELQEWVRSSP